MAAVVTRAATTDDHGPIAALVTTAFGDRGRTVAALVDDLRAGDGRVELVAESDGVEVVGHVLLSRSWVDARMALVDVLVLSPLSVAPDRQGEGIGTRLLGAAIEAARDLGAPALFLEGSPDYYGRRGFEAATPRGFARPSVRIPEPAFQVVVLDGHEPWMAGMLVYCEPFWARDCVGLRDPELADIEHMFE